MSLEELHEWQIYWTIKHEEHERERKKAERELPKGRKGRR
jgi:hypothetical protein